MNPKSDHDILRERILIRAFPPKIENVPSPTILRQTEKSEEFDRLRMNRKIMATFRYGRFGDPNKPNFNRIKAIKDKCDEFQKTGNLELMIDISNYSELEFVESRHPLKHFKAQDDSEHCEIEP